MHHSSSFHRAIVRNKNAVALQQVETPPLASDELLLAPLMAGLCGTDIQILRGERHDPALIIGHEGIARIVAMGTHCPPHLTLNSIVLINPTHPRDPRFLLGHNTNGLFQECVHIPSSAVSAGLIIPLMHVPPLKLAPLIEPLAAVLYAFQLLQLKKRSGGMIIYGDGIIGHLALILARIRFGAALPIIFVHHTQEGIEWSRAHHVNGDIDILFNQLSSAKTITHFPQLDSVLLATPRTSTLPCLSHAIEHVAPHGYIDILGGLPDDAILSDIPHLHLAQLRAANCGGFPDEGAYAHAFTKQNKPLVIFGHRGVADHHLLQAATELITHEKLYHKLISHVLDLSEAAKFMHQLSQQGARQINGQRVMKLAIRINDAAILNQSSFPCATGSNYVV